MLKSFLNSIIVFFEPSFLIPKRDWLISWKEREQAHFLASARYLLAGIAIIYSIHYPLVDVPAQKEPLSLWLNYRLSVSCIALLALASTFYKKTRNNILINRVATYTAVAFTVYMQGQSMIWRPQVPFFYVPLFAFIGTFLMNLSQGKSLFVFFSIILIAFEPFRARPHDTQHLVSASIVAAILLVMFKTSKRLEVRAYVAENQHREAQKYLIESQIELNNQMRAFLPKSIYNKVHSLISVQKKSPLEAVDEVLRPRTTTASILFSDIRGFTGLTKTMGNIAALDAIIPAQKSCTDIIENNDGVPRLQGDLVHAYFEDTEEATSIRRSILSAAQIVYATSRINSMQSRKEIQITRYIIISHGPVLVGNLGGTEGSRDITAIGDAANIPSRVDSATKDPAFKKLLGNSTIILTPQAHEQAVKEFINLESQMVDLRLVGVTLRDFDEIKYLYLINESSAVQILNRDNHIRAA